ncbi:MAG: urea ABC transporter permease subunit UrtB [Pseudomonadota bacterium]
MLQSLLPPITILFRTVLAALLALGLVGPASAQDDAAFQALVAALPDGEFDDRAQVIRQIAATGHPRAAVVLEALGAGDLKVLKDTGQVVLVVEEGRDDFAHDPFTDARIQELGRRDTRRIKINNALRREIEAAVGQLQLRHPDPALRLAAAEAAFEARDDAQLAALAAAQRDEEDPEVAEMLGLAIAASIVGSEAAEDEQVGAISVLADSGRADVFGMLNVAAQSESALIASAAASALADIERTRAMWETAQNVWFGLSLGSVLMLAAIGLAISFGVMGVINMAHGELVMLGAYTTFAVQEVIRAHAPELFGASLAIALPLAFLVSGGIGVAIERGICRYLYGRPLETLLATWGVALVLQQTVRDVFGANNVEVGNPEWMSGAFQLGQMTITYNRLWILVFALVVFVCLLVVLKKTPLGLRMRAVTQNRRMAASMGIRTGWVDAMTFGLGAGIAGIAGVALSQIGNVSPNLGQSYIVDSFMVVVFGGVGNLWGALAGAMTLGIANKFLEPFSGAVLAKVLVLVFIILFIQKRPRGMFALRGRAVEA